MPKASRMATAMHIAGWAWGAWIAFNLLVVAIFATALPVSWPCFDGFRVRIPAWLPKAIAPAELAAVVAHERGHRRHMHTWSNLALRCVFLTADPVRRRRQEHEADDYAAARGHGPALAAALRKLSAHPDDLARAERLERKQ
jgi:hypothetical protein